jgi:biotin operon repressor
MKGVILPIVGAAFICGLWSSACAAQGAWDPVAKALGRSGTEMPGGVYRVGIGRSDLTVTVDGVQIKPALALGSYLAFRKMGKEAMVMGDLVLLQEEVNPVMKKLIEQGIEITAIHNHLLRSTPQIMYMHYQGHGDAVKLASAVRTALGESKTPLEAPAKPASQPTIDLDQAAIEKTLGAKATPNGGVLQFSIPRAETIKEHGMTVPPALGMGIAINFQPTGGGKAAITGDFVLTAKEVNRVLKALRDNGIEVTALHSHMLEEQPRLFFMHFWANDDAEKLAKGLRAALDKLKLAKR